MKRFLISPLLILSFCSIAQSAEVTWFTAQTITGSTSDFISSDDLTIYNHNRTNQSGAYPGTTTGSDLTGVTYYTGAGNAFNEDYTFTSTDFEAALDSFDYDNNVNNTTAVYQNNVFTFSGLTDGQKYQIQFFFVDERNAATQSRTLNFDDGNSNLVGIDSGEYVIGSFTAIGTSQVVTATTYQASNTTTYGANINISAIAVIPEPSSFALLAGFLALGSVMVRRRRA